MKKLPKAILFDWDDTLVNTWSVAFNALNTALVAMGSESWTEDEARRRSGPSAKDLFTSLFGEDRWKEADKIYFDTFMALSKTHLEVHPQVEDLLKYLKNNGVQMAVVSNKRSVLLNHEVDALGWRGYFDCITGAGDAKADKPHPDPILHTLDKMSLSPSKDIWYVGDSATDMKCAHSAAVLAVLVETKPPPEDTLQNHIPELRFRGCYEIMEYIKVNPLVQKLKPN